MKTDWHKQREKLRKVILDFLWDQWVLLGVSGGSRAGDVPFVIDPEALLLATMRFAENDGRLRGEVLDWVLENGKLMSLQRLKNVQTDTRVGPREGLLDAARVMVEGGFRRWSAVTGWAEKVSTRMGGAFAPEGFHARGLSSPPDSRLPAAFLFRLRALFGVSARPEIITWLQTHRSGYAAEIARDTGWFSKSVQVILNELELAGFLTSEADGKKRRFSINPRQEIFKENLGENLHWFSQGMFYAGLLHVATLLASLDDSAESTPRAQAIKIREQLTPMQTAFRLAGMAEIFAACKGLTGEELVEEFGKGLEEVVRRIAER